MNRETLNKIIRNRKTIYPRHFSDKEIPESVINEILEIQRYEKKYCILIDDARAFMFPPQPPFDHKKWPDISTILRTLDLKEMRYNFIAEDVIVSLPFDKKDEIIEELHVLYPKFY